MKRQINILWTGGLDSTYRVLELSREDVIIQPYYLASVNPSTQYELKAIAELIGAILDRPETKATLLPLQVIHTSQISANTAITTAWQKLHDACSLGSQYDWIARFANQYNLVLELGIEKDEKESTIVRCLNHCGGSVTIDNNEVMVSPVATNEAKLVFKDMRFPKPLYDMTKKDEIAQYKAWQAEDILNKIWFCYRPVHGKPCGLCDPCKTYIEVGLEKMIPSNRLKLYYWRTRNKKSFEFLREAKHLLRDIFKR